MTRSKPNVTLYSQTVNTIKSQKIVLTIIPGGRNWRLETFLMTIAECSNQET
jgi:hypothetical protein